MVIEKATKSWETCSRFPDVNYTDLPDEDVWVVPDDTELADKIKSLVRRWNPVLDEHGNLIDVEWNGEAEPVFEKSKTELEIMKERLTNMEVQLAESDEVAIDLYEASLAQEAINAEQDEAIITIYEMMEAMNNG